MTPFVDELDPVIKLLVASQRENHAPMTFFEVVSYAQAERDGVRARG